MTIARKILTALLALAIAAPVFAQAQRTYSQAELDQMLAPVALYPDPLLSQVLMAATYPAELGEAARWSRANPRLQGDDAVRAVEYEDWDPSVKSLTAFPRILARMDENPGWTQSLGDAFLAQEPHVMDTVQQLRQRARAAGQLASDERLQVVEEPNFIAIRPANPQFVYVPYYDPLVVYGPWWWPAYQPVVWAPWPGYMRPYRPGVSAGFWWGAPVGLSVNFFFGNFDWQYRHVRVVHPTAYYYRPPFAVNRAVAVTPHRWQHEPLRREAFAERRAVQARQQIQVQSAAQRQERSVAVFPERAERRDARRVEQRVERQPAPVQAQPRAQPEVRPQPQARAQPETRPQAQVHQQQRPRMPEAQAPQQPRAERQGQRQERREIRQEQRNERGHKSGERS